MKLRKIVLHGDKRDVRPGDVPRNYVPLLGMLPGLDSALTIWADAASEEEVRELEQALRSSHNFAQTTQREIKFSKEPGYSITNRFYYDFSTKIVDPDGATALTETTRNRNAILAYSESNDAEFYMGMITLGSEHFGRPIDSNRGPRPFNEPPYRYPGVPQFTGGIVYLEVAPWSLAHPVVEVLRRSITAFETPRHEEVLRGILAGNIQHYTGYALFEHNWRMKQTG